MKSYLPEKSNDTWINRISSKPYYLRVNSMLKRFFLKRAIKRVLREKRAKGDLQDPRLAGLAGDDGSLDRACGMFDDEPSWFENFYNWVIENWDTILAVLLQLLILLEKEDNA
jgi:hypothetical protein